MAARWPSHVGCRGINILHGHEEYGPSIGPHVTNWRSPELRRWCSLLPVRVSGQAGCGASGFRVRGYHLLRNIRIEATTRPVTAIPAANPATNQTPLDIMGLGPSSSITGMARGGVGIGGAAGSGVGVAVGTGVAVGSGVGRGRRHGRGRGRRLRSRPWSSAQAWAWLSARGVGRGSRLRRGRGRRFRCGSGSRLRRGRGRRSRRGRGRWRRTGANPDCICASHRQFDPVYVGQRSGKCVRTLLGGGNDRVGDVSLSEEYDGQGLAAGGCRASQVRTNIPEPRGQGLHDLPQSTEVAGPDRHLHLSPRLDPR